MKKKFISLFFSMVVKRSHGLGHNFTFIIKFNKISINKRYSQGKYYIKNITIDYIGYYATAKRPKKQIINTF